MKNSDIQRLQHIALYCQDIEKDVDRFGKSLETFSSDMSYFRSVTMCLLQIGELANGLTPEFRAETNNEMQWGLVRAMRNWIAHAYQETDIDTIWSTVTGDIPALYKFCSRMLLSAESDKAE
jgi:uncharacterized protein with HEPN domain